MDRAPAPRTIVYVVATSIVALASAISSFPGWVYALVPRTGEPAARTPIAAPTFAQAVHALVPRMGVTAARTATAVAASATARGRVAVSLIRVPVMWTTTAALAPATEISAVCCPEIAAYQIPNVALAHAIRTRIRAGRCLLVCARWFDPLRNPWDSLVPQGLESPF